MLIRGRHKQEEKGINSLKREENKERGENRLHGTHLFLKGGDACLFSDHF